MHNPALEHAIRRAGGQRELARALGVHHNTVWRWANGIVTPPPRQARVIEVITGVSARDIVFPKEAD